MDLLGHVRSAVLKIVGYLVPLLQSLPAFGSWVGLMTLPFATYLFVFFSNLPVSAIDIILTFIAPSPFLVAERAIIIAGFFILFGSLIYMELKRNGGIVTSGPYRVVRHPQYLGMILSTLGLTAWSVWMLNNTFGVGFLNPVQTVGVWIIELFAYVLLALVEERFLHQTHEEIYRVYQERVPFLIPFLKTDQKALNILISIFIPLALLLALISIRI